MNNIYNVNNDNDSSRLCFRSTLLNACFSPEKIVNMNE